MPSYRLHEFSGRTVVTRPLYGVDRAHIEVPDWGAKQRRIQLFDVVRIGPHPESRRRAFTKRGVGSPIWLSKPESMSDINGDTGNRGPQGSDAGQA